MRRPFAAALALACVAVLGLAAVAARSKPSRRKSRDAAGLSREIEKRNVARLAELRIASAKYFGEHDAYYPAKLEDLAPLLAGGKIPMVAVPNHEETAEVEVYAPEACRKRKGGIELLPKKLRDTGRWGYVPKDNEACWGMIFIDCTHKNSKGKPLYDY